MRRKVTIESVQNSVTTTFTLEVELTEKQLEEYLRLKAIKTAIQLGFDNAKATKIETIEEQMNINFENPRSNYGSLNAEYTPYGGPNDAEDGHWLDEEYESEEYNCYGDFDQEESSEEVSDVDTVTGAYRPYGSSNQIPTPKSYHEKLKNSNYVPYRSISVPID